jgi:hypothetical protein
LLLIYYIQEIPSHKIDLIAFYILIHPNLSYCIHVCLIISLWFLIIRDKLPIAQTPCNNVLQFQLKTKKSLYFKKLITFRTWWRWWHKLIDFLSFFTNQINEASEKFSFHFSLTETNFFSIELNRFTKELLTKF